MASAVETAWLKRRSLRALDLVNFFQADLQTGVGPFLAVYLFASRRWKTGPIGMAMAAQGIATIVGQAPAGAIVDRIAGKRWLIAVAAAVVGIGSILIVQVTGVALVTGVQAMIGLAGAAIPIAIAATSLGIVGRSGFAKRMGRNEAFNHAGNVFGAAIAGMLGEWFGQGAIFCFAAVMALATIGSVLAIRETDIDHAIAREAATDKSGMPIARAIGTVFTDSRLLIFGGCVVLFHFANAAMLPLLGELLAHEAPGQSAGYMSACIVVAQLVMTPVALLAGRMATTSGRKATLMIGFAALPMRGLLYTMTRTPILLVALQILDGVGAGIFGVVWVIVASDLAENTGRFNLIQGAINTAVAIGASMSNLMTGFIVQRAGFNAGFAVLAAIAAAALVLLGIAMPETMGDSKTFSIG
jgi:MFS family permease